MSLCWSSRHRAICDREGGLSIANLWVVDNSQSACGCWCPSQVGFGRVETQPSHSIYTAISPLLGHLLSAGRLECNGAEAAYEELQLKASAITPSEPCPLLFGYSVLEKLTACPNGEEITVGSRDMRHELEFVWRPRTAKRPRP